MREETSSATWARRARVAARVLLAPVLLLCVVWASAALWFDGPGGRVFAAILAAGFPLACLGLLLWVRPLRRGALAVVVAFVVVLVWWRLIPPRNDRNWQRDVARTASVELQGSRI
ncbi:MAG: hypothetical protein HGA98_03285, partial [Deltaproteobacteria bacterium]|nr:hypothetical protein [Deltaproteobacteria bacterium]